MTTILFKATGLNDGRTSAGRCQFGRGGFCGRGLARARTEQLHVVGWKPADLAFLSSSLSRRDQRVSKLLALSVHIFASKSLSPHGLDPRRTLLPHRMNYLYSNGNFQIVKVSLRQNNNDFNVLHDTSLLYRRPIKNNVTVSCYNLKVPTIKMRNYHYI